MAQTLGTLLIDIKADTSKLVQGFTRAEGQINSSIKSMKSNILGLTTAYLSLGTAVDLSRKFVANADAMSLVSSRLQIVTKDSEKLVATQKELYAIAQNARVSYLDTADLYAKMARATQAYGIEQSKLTKVTENISKSITISGESAQSTIAAIRQLGQAFSGDFKTVGQELQSIREQAPRVYQMMVEGMGVTRSEFKKMAEDGKLSTELIIEALLKGSKKVDEEFSKINKTAGQSIEQVNNAFLFLVDDINKTYFVTKTLSDGFTNLSKSIDTITPEDIDTFVNSVILLGEAFLAYKASVIATTIAQQAYNSVQAKITAQTAAQTAATLAQSEAERLGTIALKTRQLAEVAKIEAQRSGLAVLATHNEMLQKQAKSAEEAAKKAVAHSYALEDVAKKANLSSKAIGFLTATLKTIAPMAILFAITEVFLNWEKITGKIKTNLVTSAEELKKMTVNQLLAQLNELNNKIKETDLEIQKLLPKSKGFSYFGTTSEEDKTAIKSQIDTLKQQREEYKNLIDTISELRKEKELDNKETYKRINITKDMLEDASIEFRRREKEAYEPFNLSEEQLKEQKRLEEERIRNAEKLAEDWAKRNLEITTNMAIAEQDELAKPFIVLEAKYKEDLETFKGVQGAKERLTLEYNAELKRLYEDLTKKFSEEEAKKAEKVAEWQIKILEANEKYNEEIIKMRDEMYGTDTSIEAWYDNQLEYLGKLSQEAGATAEQLQELLNKIETIRDMKLEKQTISFKVEQSFYQSFENNLANSIEDAFNGNSLNLKSFYKNISSNLAKTISGSLANTFTGGFRSSGSLLGGLGALATGSAVSASEISSIMNAGGTFNEATNTISTAGGTAIKLGADGGGTITSSGSDIMSLVSGISTLKTAYSVLSGGVSGTIASGFNSIAGGFDALGMTGVGNTVGQFGYGFANPFSANTSFGAIGAGSTVGAGLLGGAVGYGVGYLGDKLLGANSHAGVGGAIGGASGALIGSQIGAIGGPVGMLIGSAVGSALGGIFGKKTVTDTGYNFLSDAYSNNIDVEGYSDWKKKGWFSSSKGSTPFDLTSTKIKEIEAVFITYDYLLTQLGDSDKIFLEAGKYSKETWQDAIAKNFITAFTDISQTTDDTIYQAWVDYAESVDKTVIQALTESVNSYISSMRDFELWALNRSGNGIEALAKQSEWLTADFNNLAQTVGVVGVTVENYSQMYKDAVSNSFDPDTITKWQSLGSALQAATNAADAYNQAIQAQQESQYQATLSSLSNIYALNIKIADLQIQKALIEKGITQDNLTALQAQKSSIKTIMDMATSMRDKLLSASSIPNVYKSVLESARIDFSKGDYSSDNISRLGEVSELYADSLQKYSLSEADYQFGVLKIASEIESITGKTTTLADVESEIERVTKALQSLEPTLDSQLEALYAQKDAYVTQTDRQIAQFEALMGANSPLVQMLKVSLESAKTGSVGGATLLGSNVSGTLADVANIYTKLGLNQYQTDTTGYEYWANQVNSGAIAPSQLENNIRASAEEILGKKIGFASGGYTGNIGIQDIAGVVHGQEYVVNAQTTKDLGLNKNNGGVFQDMVNELKSLRAEVAQLMSKNLAYQDKIEKNTKTSRFVGVA